MKIKKYTASSMPAAMKQVREELGGDAVILNSRIIHFGGVFGLFRKKGIEVLAAVDPIQEHSAGSAKVNDKITISKSAARITKDQQIPEEKESKILQEISELKVLMRTQTETGRPVSILPNPLQTLAAFLKKQEIDSKIREELLASVLGTWYRTGANASASEVENWAKEAIEKRLSGMSYGGVSFKKKYVNVIGPTGVGKTTTLAKIAAECVLNHQKKVAFITTDTYRIGAIEQLKTYANILGVPIEVCYSKEDFKGAADKFHEYDVVLIDTAGRNFRDRKYVDDLKQIIDFDREMETFLVLSLTAKQLDMEEICKQFSLVPIDKFIFTKTDETSVYGALINLPEKFSRGIAYLSNGQDVPDDLLSAEPAQIAKLLFGDGKDGSS
ncbi:flagellar biosynthesis protein FlhF [Mesobacillus foraminis]|uniref:flagellar biosynthesis protein FlhF n=1 Tax=Mesobacillus foraminis TaxID=279826 RepID=UPI0039A101EF